MQTEDKARIARLEQLLDEKQTENIQLTDDLEKQIAELERENAELKRAMSNVIMNTIDLLTGIGRQVENERTRLDQILGRPLTKDSKIVDELIKDRQAAS